MAQHYRVREGAGATRPVEVGNGVQVGGGQPVVLAGPCGGGSCQALLAMARRIRTAGAHLVRVGAPCPHGLPSAEPLDLDTLAAVRDAAGLPMVVEVQDPAHVPLLARYADVLQVGPAHMQNFPLLRALGRVDRPVILYRGPAAQVEEWLLAAEYILAGGNPRVILCEGGIRTFATYSRHTLDLGSALAARHLTHLPVIADPSHGAGRQELVVPLVQAALAAGLDGVAVAVQIEGDAGGCPGALDSAAFQALMARLGLAPPPADIDACRALIDRIDQELLRLLVQRMAVARCIGDLKAAAGLPVYQPDREEALLHRLTAQAQGALTPAAVRAIWSAIFAESRRLQAAYRSGAAAPAQAPGGAPGGNPAAGSP